MLKKDQEKIKTKIKGNKEKQKNQKYTLGHNLVLEWSVGAHGNVA